jgi:hypothetical protein
MSSGSIVDCWRIYFYIYNIYIHLSFVVVAVVDNQSIGSVDGGESPVAVVALTVEIPIGSRFQFMSLKAPMYIASIDPFHKSVRGSRILIYSILPIWFDLI